MFPLKQYRSAKGLYQKDVAKYLGVDRTTYAKYQAGVIEPPIPVIIQLASLFNVSIEQIIGIQQTKEKPAQQMDRQSLLSQIDLRFSQLPQDLKHEAMAYVAGRIASKKD